MREKERVRIRKCEFRESVSLKEKERVLKRKLNSVKKEMLRSTERRSEGKRE